MMWPKKVRYPLLLLFSLCMLVWQSHPAVGHPGDGGQLSIDEERDASRGDAAGMGASEPSGYNLQRYFPLALGDNWTYSTGQETRSFVVNGEEEAFTKEMTLRVMEDGGEYACYLWKDTGLIFYRRAGIGGPYRADPPSVWFPTSLAAGASVALTVPITLYTTETGVVAKHTVLRFVPPIGLPHGGGRSGKAKHHTRVSVCKGCGVNPPRCSSELLQARKKQKPPQGFCFPSSLDPFSVAYLIRR